MRNVALAAALLLALLSPKATAVRTSTARRRPRRRSFVWLSDVHADPYYGTVNQQCVVDKCKSKEENADITSASKFGVIGCDPPFDIFASALEAVKALGPEDPAFELFTGDFVRHAQDKMPQPRADTAGVIGKITRMLAESHTSGRRGTVSVGTMGNDDSPKNYEVNITTGSQFNGWLDQVAGEYALGGAMLNEQQREFAYGGYYSQRLGGKAGLKIIHLNTIIYSVNHTPKSNESDPFNQFKWLQNELFEASEQREKVWIFAHIPPGIETYGYDQLWEPRFLERYLEIVQDDVLGGVIAAQLFGHVHAEEFRLLPNPPRGAGPMLTMAAISPVYRNNPSFRVVDYDERTKAFLGYKEYYAQFVDGADELEWKLGYEMSSAFPALGRAPYTMDSWESLYDELEAGTDSAWGTYAKWYKTNYKKNDLMACSAEYDQGQDSAVRERCRRKYLCSVIVRTKESNDACWMPEAAAAGNSSSSLLEMASSVRSASKSCAGGGPVTETTMSEVYQNYQVKRAKHQAYLMGE